MKKKAQIEPIPLILGIIGAIIGFFIAGKTQTGFIWKVLTTLVSGVVCYMIGLKMSN